MTARRVRVWAIALTGLAAALHDGAPGAAQVATREATEAQAYVLGPGDLVEVTVLGQPEFTTRAKIRADGQIVLPFLNAVMAAGETNISLAQVVAARLRQGGYYTKPIVAVEIAGYASRTVSVLGAVGLPGIVPIDRPYRLSEILARSGGLREGAAEEVIVRHDGAPEAHYAYDRLGTGDPHDDPMIGANDTVFVPLAPTFSIYGQVTASGIFAIKGRMTVRQAIARAGGLRDTGSEHRVHTVRDGVGIRVHLDDLIRPNDVIQIGERLF